MYNLRNQKIDFDYQPQFITEEVHNGKLARSRTEAGDLLMNIVGPPLGKLAIIPANLPQANFNQAAVLIRPYVEKETLVSCLKAYLEEMSEINSIATRGSAGQVNISLTQSQNMHIPLPPLNEQKRLLVELNHWMVCVSMIEDGKEELTDSINQAKSKILDLAIHGKLVPQDPTNEPAIDLLRRINPKFTPCDNAQYVKLPKGWTVATLRQCDINVMNGYAFQSKKYTNHGIRIIRITNVQDGEIVDDDPKFYPDNSKEEIERYMLKSDDFLMSLTGNVGRVGFLPKGMLPAALNQRVACFRFEEQVITKKYLWCVFRTECFKEDCINSGKGIAQLNISTEWLKNYTLPIPPYAEQQRIVARIEELFATLDKIQNSLEA